MLPSLGLGHRRGDADGGVRVCAAHGQEVLVMSFFGVGGWGGEGCGEDESGRHDVMGRREGEAVEGQQGQKKTTHHPRHLEKEEVGLSMGWGRRGGWGVGGGRNLLASWNSIMFGLVAISCDILGSPGKGCSRGHL